MCFVKGRIELWLDIEILKKKTCKTLKIGLIKIRVNKVIKASPIYSSALSEQCCSDTPAAPTGAFESGHPHS